MLQLLKATLMRLRPKVVLNQNRVFNTSGFPNRSLGTRCKAGAYVPRERLMPRLALRHRFNGF